VQDFQSETNFHQCLSPSIEFPNREYKLYHPQISPNLLQNQYEWSNLIPVISWSYRASTTISHGFSPFEVLFGKKMRTPIDPSILNDVRTSTNIDVYLQHMLPKIQLTRDIAKQNMHDCNDDTQFYYDRNTAYPRYTVGQKVLLYDPVAKKSVCKKLKRRWLRSFHTVSEGDVYGCQLRKYDDGQEMRAYVHSNRLRPFTESRDMYYTRNPPSTDRQTTTQPPATAIMIRLHRPQT